MENISLEKLMETFENEFQFIKSNKEAYVRQKYIDPFFMLLGWDFNSNDVIPEDTVKIAGKPKSPDYSFRINDKRQFFVEAKKISVNIKDDKVPAFQVRRYGYNGKLPLCILTDFEEFAIYDTRIQPHKDDNSNIARIFYCTYKDYPEKFEYIKSIFSKEAIIGGSLSQWESENKLKKGTEPVDEAFLNEIAKWRELLAKNIFSRNGEEKIKVHELNDAVQRIIDRIIFLRIAEDRNIEDYGTLKRIVEGKSLKNQLPFYSHLLDIFKNAKDKYNSDLFDVNNLLPSLTIDDTVLKQIINTTYYPSPYEFSIMPIEILGSVYERFLGKTIRLTEKRAVVDDKPEVRKAGGVYYTPEYIVDYIVKNTVGELVKDKTPDKTAKLKILDPACGSGSFLVNAFDYLLKYHLDYYTQPQNIKKAVKENKIYEYHAEKNYFKLKIEEKQKILLNNIYGVDIDPQAVEVTKLSLLLKLMENETFESVDLLKHSHLKALPNLKDNIKCGNSLIGSDFYSQGNETQGKLNLTNQDNKNIFSEEEKRKINVFDWENEFPGILKNGGFDCVIGNPPYFNIETLGVGSELANYIKNRYSYIWMDKSDILFYFIAKGIEISKGLISYIISNAFLFSDKAQKLRSHIINNTKIEKIVNFEQYLVFKDASITTSILTLDKTKKNKITKAINLKEKNYTQDYINQFIANHKNYFNVNLKDNDVFALIDDRKNELNNKINKDSPILRDVFKIGSGMQTAANKVFLFNEYPAQFPKEFIKKRMSGEIISRYFINNEKEYLLYFENIDNFNDLPESIKNHLKQNKSFLSNRADKKRRKTANWWNYSFPMHKEHYHLNKIWCSYRSKNNAFIFDDTKEYIGLTNTTVIFDTNDNLDLKYLLALLNSKLFNFRYKSIGKQTGSGIFEYFENGVGKLPVKEINQDQQKPFILLVDQMLETQKKHHSARTDNDKILYQREIDRLDNEIDQLVYKLYDLTDDEIAIVEESVKR